MHSFRGWSRNILGVASDSLGVWLIVQRLPVKLS